MTGRRPPFPPFTQQTALRQVRTAEVAWNTRDPHLVALACAPDCSWSYQGEFISGREEIVEFLALKWERELDYVLQRSLLGFRENRVAARFRCEWHDKEDRWWRGHGDELWEFDDRGFVRRLEISVDDFAILRADRLIPGRCSENEQNADVPI